VEPRLAPAPSMMARQKRDPLPGPAAPPKSASARRFLLCLCHAPPSPAAFVPCALKTPLFPPHTSPHESAAALFLQIEKGIQQSSASCARSCGNISITDRLGSRSANSVSETEFVRRHAWGSSSGTLASGPSKFCPCFGPACAKRLRGWMPLQFRRALRLGAAAPRRAARGRFPFVRKWILEGALSGVRCEILESHLAL